LSALKKALGDERFAAAWADGEARSLEASIAEALSQPESAAAEAARAQQEHLGGLTPRERQVAALIVQGKSNKEIAAAMTVTLKTAEAYVSRILHRLGFNSRAQIAVWAKDKDLSGPAG
jgi:non-specific serine/threonine protein kinase